MYRLSVNLCGILASMFCACAVHTTYAFPRTGRDDLGILPIFTYRVARTFVYIRML